MPSEEFLERYIESLEVDGEIDPMVIEVRKLLALEETNERIGEVINKLDDIRQAIDGENEQSNFT